MNTERKKLEACLFYNANAFSRLLTKLAEEVFSRTGMSPSYGYLITLVNEYPAIGPSRLSESLQLSPSTVSRFLDKLETKGMITRVIEGKNVHVFPTQKSLAFQNMINQCMKDLLDRMNHIAGEGKVHEVNQLLLETSEYFASSDSAYCGKQ